MRYEYKVVPAPEKGDKVKGVKDPESRFAASIEQIMNDMAQRGWEYQRSETLPSEERSGLTQTATVWRNLLVFRRPDAEDVNSYAPRMLAPPQIDEPPTPRELPETQIHDVAQAKPQPDPAKPARTVKIVSKTAKRKATPAATPTDRGPASQPDAPAEVQPVQQLPSVLTARASRLKANGS
ncbi:DUF4177 domain-containing protein [Thalassococcus lentus]|uniref:DUF4177 domain-containing protein n=1 Tax=Thalassococcus lentus TaxID=1210524 RepID=A0ABT4XX43_9RHOB|nr:DUF4177 domain-containing protein [Thalassococcus lentus]MDA7426540.1 DUF4177 domain-containing protein [Thalassococcus lentus]